MKSTQQNADSEPMPVRTGAQIAPRLLGACLLAVSCIAAGCGSDGPAERDLGIAQAIQRSPEFSTPYSVSLPVLSDQECEDATKLNPEWARWASLGLAEAKPLVRAEGKGCRLHLLEWVRQDIETHAHLLPALPRRNAGADHIVVPLANRNLLRLLSTSRASRETWEVEFQWQWRPNRVGESLSVDRQPHKGWSRVGWDDSGWRVMLLRFDGESLNAEGS
jgi:hypothetical protein